MNIFTILLLFSCVAPRPASAAMLKLHSGGDVLGTVVSVDRENIVLKDGKKVPRQNIEEIDISSKQQEQSPSTPSDSQAFKHSRELFQQAGEFEKQYPDVDGIVLLNEERHHLQADGTWISHYSFTGKILKEGLKQSWGEISSSFEEGRSRVKIIKATVYRPDGKIFSLEPDKIRISKPQGDAVSFMEYSQMHYSLPEIEVGSIVEYETEYDMYNPFRKDFFFPTWGFQDSQPALVSRVSITIPASQSLYYWTGNFTGTWKRHVKPQIVQGRGERTYTWELRNVPPIAGEPLMPPYEQYAPHVNASLFKDWKRLFDWFEQMANERTNPSPELAAFTRELVKSCKTNDEKVAAVYHYIQREIRYVDIKLGIASGMGGYDANLTWKRRFGCCIDKANLFTAMLKVLGIKSSPVYLNPNNEGPQSFNIPILWFSHAITAIELGGRKLFLDSTASDFRYPSFRSDDHGAEVLEVFARRFERIPVPKPSENLSDFGYQIDLNPDGDATVHYTAAYNGVHEAGVRAYYKNIKESERKKVFQDWVNGISPSSELLEYRLENVDDISKPFSFSLAYRMRNYPIRAADLYIFKLPDFEDDFPEIALDKRRYDIQYETAFERKYHYKINLPAGFEAVSLLQPVNLEGNGEAFSESCSAQPGAIVCDADLRRSKREYKAAEYPTHKAFLEKVGKLTKDRIFLRARPLSK